MKKVYFEKAAKDWGATDMMVFRVAVVDCIDTTKVIETVEMIESNCCALLLEKMKKSAKVKAAYKRNPYTVLAVINEGLAR